ncbi:MAG: glycosyltransferase family 4 protein [Chloroflexia bacterium]|nr:glycosyltransferase family 4 protein [Chloroflexia bacterium]
MRILYVASGIPVPGKYGGSTHTLEVARGLLARGHNLRVVAAQREGWSGLGACFRLGQGQVEGVPVDYVNIPKAISFLGWPYIGRLVRCFEPDLIMERYYNFAGAGMYWAHRLGLPAVLEVNALIVDPPEVSKRRLDDRLGGPMRRWALAQCRWADRIITPLHTTVPPEIPRQRIVEIPWGANVERFRPTLAQERPAELAVLRERLGLPPTGKLFVFVGSFRPWHGAVEFVEAGIRLLEHGRDVSFLLVGKGPLWSQVASRCQQSGHGQRFHLSGSVPYDQVPLYLALATAGVAPFQPRCHPALRAAGFFWSPLKVFEYMAMGLPVVTTDVPPLNRIVRPGQEGLLVNEGDMAGLAQAMERLLDSPEEAGKMGRRARERVAAEYSWTRHCQRLERVLEAIVHERYQ